MPASATLETRRCNKSSSAPCLPCCRLPATCLPACHLLVVLTQSAKRAAVALVGKSQFCGLQQCSASGASRVRGWSTQLAAPGCPVANNDYRNQRWWRAPGLRAGARWRPIARHSLLKPVSFSSTSASTAFQRSVPALVNWATSDVAVAVRSDPATRRTHHRAPAARRPLDVKSCSGAYGACAGSYENEASMRCFSSKLHTRARIKMGAERRPAKTAPRATRHAPSLRCRRRLWRWQIQKSRVAALQRAAPLLLV